MMRWIAIAISLLAMFLFFVLYPMAYAQEHRHGDKVIPDEIGRFYATWMQPNNRMVSCCSRMDCAATEARIENGRWRAYSRVQGRWIDIPASKIEREREVPPGAHLCENSSGVLCFGAGGGT